MPISKEYRHVAVEDRIWKIRGERQKLKGGRWKINIIADSGIEEVDEKK